MTNEANVWNPRTQTQISGNTKSVSESFIATASQQLFITTKFVYALNTGALEVHKNGLLLEFGLDWLEVDIDKFSLLVPAAANDVILATAHVGIQGTVVADSNIINSENLEFTTSLGSIKHVNADVGFLVRTNYFSAARTKGSGVELNHTGVTIGDKAGNTPNADGFFYDVDGKQFQVVDTHMNVLVFGAIGDGTIDDSAALTAANAAGSVLLLPKGIYAVSTDYTFTNIVSEDATIKLADAAILGILEFLNLSAGGTIQGILTVDANRANNTNVIYAIALRGGDHIIETLITNNAEGLGVRGYDVGDSVIQTLISDNCAQGFVGNFAFSGGNIETIICNNLDSNVIGVFQHAVEFKEGRRVTIGTIEVLNADGGTLAPSGSLTAVLYLDWNFSTTNNIHIESMLSTTLKPLALSVIGSTGSSYNNTSIRGYEGARQIELKDGRDCKFNTAYVFMRFNVVRGVGALSSSTGLVTANGNNNSAPSHNTFNDITIINGTRGVLDGGFGNIYNNVRVFGSLDSGFVFQEINESTAFPAAGPSYGQIHGAHSLTSCSANGCGESGVALDAAIDSFYATNCDFSGNGTDITATSSLRAGVSYTGATNLKIHLDNCILADRFASISAPLGLTSQPVGPLVENEFLVTFVKGASNIYPGQIILMSDGKPGGGNLELKITEMTGVDEALAVANDGSTGALPNKAQVATGASVSGVLNGTALTGVGTLFNSEMPGKLWWFFDGSTPAQVTAVGNDLSLAVLPAFSGTFTDVTPRFTAYNLTGLQRQQFGFSGGEITMTYCDVFGNVSATPADSVNVGILEVGTVSVPATSGVVYTYVKSYPVPPKVIVTPINGAISIPFSISAPNVAGVNVFNGSAVTVLFNVLVMG